MQQQLSPRGKTVEHYQLHNLFSVTPVAQFWTASHKVLKKSFVLKKIKLPWQGLNSVKTDNSMPQSFDLAKYETSLLNLLKLQGSPKCQKLIRTTASTYIVYDTFPGDSLTRYIQKQRPTITQLLKLMIDIAAELDKFHLRGLVFFLLSTDNIYISDNYRLTFTDWTLAQKKDQPLLDRRSILQLLHSTLNFNIKPDSTSYEADVYSLGKIFNSVITNYRQLIDSSIQEELFGLILLMTCQNDRESLPLKQVIRSLHKIRQSLITNQPSTPTFASRQYLNKSGHAEEKINRQKLKRAGSDFQLLLKQDQEIIIPQAKTSRGQFTQKGLGENSCKTPTSNRLSSTSSEHNLSNVKNIGKIILKNRSLAFFLISLSQFTQEMGPELSFMLLRKALTAMKSAQAECQKLKNLHHQSFSKVQPLVNSEINKIQRLISRFKQNLREVTLEGEGRRLISTQSSVDLKYLHRKIIQFVKQRIKDSRTNSLTFAQTVETYFQMYLLTKSIECGSYQLFWDRTFNKADPGSQAGYFNRQKKLGLRFFKSKLQEIVEAQA